MPSRLSWLAFLRYSQSVLGKHPKQLPWCLPSPQNFCHLCVTPQGAQTFFSFQLSIWILLKCFRDLLKVPQIYHSVFLLKFLFLLSYSIKIPNSFLFMTPKPYFTDAVIFMYSSLNTHAHAHTGHLNFFLFICFSVCFPCKNFLSDVQQTVMSACD